MGQFAEHGRRLAGTSLLVLLVVAATAWGQGPGGSAPSGAAPDVVNVNAAADPLPAQITSEYAATWEENGEKVLLLQGTIRIDQGSSVVTMGRGVAWIRQLVDVPNLPFRIQVYGEDGVQIVVNGDKKQSQRGLFEFTASQYGVKATTTPLINQNYSKEAVYVRALSERTKRMAAMPRSPIQQVQNVDPIPPPPPPFAAPGVPGPTPPTSPTLPATPPPPGQPPFFGTPAPPPAVPGAKSGTPRRFSIRPRTAEEIRIRKSVTSAGETIWIVPSPVIVSIDDPNNPKGTLDIEADRMVFWSRGDGEKAFESMKGPQGETTQHIELYLAGNVEMRAKNKKDTETIRADEVYYDCTRNVAIATKCDLEIHVPKLTQSVHVKTPELQQLNAKTFQATKAEVYSTELPSDPGLTFYLRTVTIEEREVPKKRLFGGEIIDPNTGKPMVDRYHYFNGRNAFVFLEGVPVFWFPFLKGDVEDPLGPLENFSFGYSNSVFGFTLQSTWDLYQLLGIQQLPGTKWRLYADYFSARGPALGTEFGATGIDLFGIKNKYDGFIKAYGIYDSGYDGTRTDILGGDRGVFYFPPPPGTQIPYTHPEWRGRVKSMWNVQDLPDGFTAQVGIGLISDQNYIEQYWLAEWLNDYNQETFIYLKQQQEQWAWSVLAEPRLRPWITEAGWLPRADFWLLGHKFFDDNVTYMTHASAGYANFRTPNVPSFAYLPTDVNVDSGRFDWWNELSMPFTAGPFRFTPYLVGDIAYYTANVNDDGQSRFLGGAGLRVNLPFSRLFPDVKSDFFNVDSIYHKINFTTNYLYERSSVSYNNLPQLDRLNDDASDQAMRDLQTRQIFINPSNAALLTNVNSIINPQTYAIRRMIDSRIDTMDSMNVFQFGMENRWQTLRGLAASEHVVDWMTLSLGASLFPQPSRDNYGQNWGILEYDYLWNIGDRTAIVSNGWMEPGSGNPRVFNIGGNINRPDNTSFYLGYRQLDPLQSKAVIGSVTYAFSKKYSMYASTVWDFGVNVQSYTIGFTRTGTDMVLNAGISVSSVTNNFGFQLEFLPILVKSNMRTGGGIGNGMLMGR